MGRATRRSSLPAHWFTDHPETIHRAALGINAVFGGATAVAAIAILRRMARILTSLASLHGFIAATAPAVLLIRNRATADPLTAFLF